MSYAPPHKPAEVSQIFQPTPAASTAASLNRQSRAAPHPSLQPALGQTQIDLWGRASRVALYRIRPHTLDGRRTVA